MIKIGKIYEIDERFGTIVNEDGDVSFSVRDLFDPDIKKGDIVEYREESRDPDIKLARNITKVKERKDV